ncbi:MAG: GTPase RsgA, partial [Candidatus Competibacteraceae bacterium]|nr:GTPase RsgA [Candidatus Competibacteraceae bacterium]
RATGMGTHTTTTATLYPLPDGGELIDSPGVRSFELSQELTLVDLERGFPEFAPYLGQCRFSNCAHGLDPGCALQQAAAQGAIDPRRLESYHQLRLSLKAVP